MTKKEFILSYGEYSGGSGAGGRQAMKCDDHHRRNSTVSVLFVSGVPWVSPAVLPTTLVSASTHPLVRQDKTVYMTLKNT